MTSSGIWLRCRGNGLWTWRERKEKEREKTEVNNGQLEYDEVTGEEEIVKLLKATPKISNSAINNNYYYTIINYY